MSKTVTVETLRALSRDRPARHAADLMKGSPGKVLGLFASLGAVTGGGVEASGRLAWSAIADAIGKEHSQLFCYERGISDSAQRFPVRVPTGEVVFTASKLGSVLRALAVRERVRLVVVWHLGLLKLLPFFRLADAKVVLFLHGIESWRFQPWLTQRLLRKVDLFLSNSDHAWMRFISFNPCFAHARHQTVNLGIDVPVEGAMAPPFEPPAALMISRLLRGEDYKGHREMISAWPLVRKSIAGAELWIAGDGDLRAELETMVRSRGLAGQVRFFGRVSEEEKHELLMRSRCLAMPSRGEGFGLVYLEAMRLGRPCLVSTLDAGREVVSPPHAGLAVDPTNSQGLAEMLCRLLSSGPEWRQWSASARRRYEDNFTARHFQERLLDALNAVFA